MNNTDKATGLTAAQTTGQHLDATATMLLQLTNSVDSRRWEWTAIDTDNGDAYGPFPTLALAEAWVDGQTDADDFHIMRLRNPVDFTPHA